MTPLLALLRHGAVFFVMAALMLIIKEQFPFSNFPMYSSLPESAKILQLVDAEDHLIPTWPIFGTTVSVLKKKVNYELSALRDKGEFKKRDDAPPEVLQAVGAKVLKWLLETYPCKQTERKGQVVKLQEITLRIKDGRLVRSIKTLAEDRI